jgi:hypothetical protein
MSATTTLVKQKSTGRTVHINDVDVADRQDFCCSGCGKDVVVVKSDARIRDWHFRHPPDEVCTGGRDTALHDYAVQILLESDSISLTKSLHIQYSEPRKEVYIYGKRSDVTVKFGGEDVHFEVVVTHDLDEEKIALYKTNKAKCVRIDLTETSLLSAIPETIQEVVLKDIRVKSLIYWNDEIQKEKLKEGFSLKDILVLGITLTAILVAVKKLFKPKRTTRQR